MAKVVPSKGAQEYAVEVVRKFVEQLGHNKVIMKSDDGAGGFSAKGGGQERGERGDRHGGGAGWRSPGKTEWQIMLGRIRRATSGC